MASEFSGQGNGSISAWLAERVWPGGKAVAIDLDLSNYTIRRKLAPRLASLGLIEISGAAETAIYNGGSSWADYWIQTISELRNDLISLGKVDEALVDTFLAYCADSTWWTQTIAFTAVAGRAPAV